MATLRSNLDVVCHQTRSPDNLGAVVRLMANFGVARLILSDPATYAFREAEKLAIGGEHLLETMKVAASLGEAVGDAVYAVGTTSRTALKGRVALSPEQAVRQLAVEAKRGRVALVFGGEKRGLSDEDLSVCQDVLVIPTEEAQPSMNLSQSVAVMLYLCAREESPAPAEEEPPGARLETLRALDGRMEEVLLEAGYLNPQAPEHVTRELLRSLSRARLSQREAEMWLSAFQHLKRTVKR